MPTTSTTQTPPLTATITQANYIFFNCKVRQAANGFIVDSNGAEHVFTEAKQLFDFITSIDPKK